MKSDDKEEPMLSSLEELLKDIDAMGRQKKEECRINWFFHEGENKPLVLIHPMLEELLGDITKKEPTTPDEYLLWRQAVYILQRIEYNLQHNAPFIVLSINIRDEIMQRLIPHGFSLWHHIKTKQQHLLLPGASAEAAFYLFGMKNFEPIHRMPL